MPLVDERARGTTVAVIAHRNQQGDFFAKKRERGGIGKPTIGVHHIGLKFVN